MDNRIELIGALRRYIALLREQEQRLMMVKDSPAWTAEDRANADASLTLNTKKLHDADKDLRDLENRRK